MTLILVFIYIYSPVPSKLVGVEFYYSEVRINFENGNYC